MSSELSRPPRSATGTSGRSGATRSAATTAVAGARRRTSWRRIVAPPDGDFPCGRGSGGDRRAEPGQLIDPDRGVIDPAAEFLDYPLHDLAARTWRCPSTRCSGPRVARGAVLQRRHLLRRPRSRGRTRPDRRDQGEPRQDHDPVARLQAEGGPREPWINPRRPRAGHRGDRLTRPSSTPTPSPGRPNDASGGRSVETYDAVEDCRALLDRGAVRRALADFRFLRERLGTSRPKIANGEFTRTSSTSSRLAQDCSTSR